MDDSKRRLSADEFDQRLRAIVKEVQQLQREPISSDIMRISRDGDHVSAAVLPAKRSTSSS